MKTLELYLQPKLLCAIFLMFCSDSKKATMRLVVLSGYTVHWLQLNIWNNNALIHLHFIYINVIDLPINYGKGWEKISKPLGLFISNLAQLQIKVRRNTDLQSLSDPLVDKETAQRPPGTYCITLNVAFKPGLQYSNAYTTILMHFHILLLWCLHCKAIINNNS